MSLSSLLSQAARNVSVTRSSCLLPVSSRIVSHEILSRNDVHAPPQLQQVRWRSAKKRRHTVQPFWHAQVTRTMYPEGITPENEEFVGQVIQSTYDAKQEESPLERAPWPRGEWAPKSQRCGLIGKKLGNMILWSKTGDKHLATMIHISDNHVIRYVPAKELIKNTHDYFAKISKRPRGALIVGADSADPRLFTKEYYNMFEEAGVMPKKKLTKFLVTDNAVLQPGTPLYATHFRPGDHVNITGFSIDRGYQGVVKRWGFRGGPAAHGSTKFHNKPGYIGCGGKRSIVMPGKKMAGHMGMEFVTGRGFKILRINSHFNVIWVLGKIPGAINDYVNIYDSSLFHHRHKDPENHPPFPTHYPAEQPIEKVDWYADHIHDFKDKSIVFEDEAAAA